MTKQFPERKAKSDTLRSPEATENTQLSYQGTYLCPVCRHGQITELTLMDAFACSFCRHIFTANLESQTVQVVDSSQPMSWRWTGRTWQVAHRDELNLTLVIWLVGIAVALMPPSIVWLSAYTFPPLPGSRWAWFPAVWVGCTLFIHLLLVAWLLAEHYQVPFYVSSKIRLRSLFDRS
ncbi:hypothetical protein [Oculatella sp. FACHB-28]|uniref:hypothetical protein n=1 Tax=Oculatella sp. FACHB-28 TaxID=2692845 RepID=UPI001F5498ED|nr:hypothetical protein [Oculatella sp. FACHB-28]